MSELLKMDEPRKRYAAMMSGLDIHYDLGAGHPLLGRRMPDLDLVTASGPRRVFTLLHDARPVLLNLGEPGDLDVAPWADRVQRSTLDTPVCGSSRRSARSPLPPPCLIRPDGHVAWVGEGTDLGLVDALTTWFGPPTSSAGGWLRTHSGAQGGAASAEDFSRETTSGQMTQVARARS